MLDKTGDKDQQPEVCSDCGGRLNPLQLKPDPDSCDTSAASPQVNTDGPRKCAACQAGSSSGGSPPNGRRLQRRTRLDPHSCNLCTKTFISSAHLALHLSSHSKERKYRCSTCGKFFSQSAHLVAHKTIHSGDRPFKCPECGKTFGRASHLKTHRRLHTGEKPFKCSFCGKAFTQKAGLLAHVRQHTGDNPYKCEQCGAGFRSLPLLLSHKAQEASGHTKPTPPAPTPAAQLSRPQKTPNSAEDLKCGICCRTFVHSSYIRLDVHFNKGLRPYHCKVCNKTFVKLETFVNHCDKHLSQKKEENEVKYKVVRPPLFVPLSRPESAHTFSAQPLFSEVNTRSKAKSKTFTTEP
uniref:C2H2-type domain-containing protein n=1 Tax=Nothobranchius kadleci TaxID=1051664 RepID=A0A1A8D7D5_NOTKA